MSFTLPVSQVQDLPVHMLFVKGRRLPSLPVLLLELETS